jgi:NADH dehydrogenase FAD-containing subunit
MQHYDKHVVIIGGSYAGFTILNLLYKKAKVTLIDKKDHFECIFANMKTLVGDNDVNDFTISFEDVVKGL